MRHWRLDRDQERPPTSERRELYRQPGFGGGMDRIVVELPTEDAERLMNLLDAYLDWLYRHPPVDKDPVDPPRRTAVDKVPWIHRRIRRRPATRDPCRRVDALLDLLEHAAHEHHDSIDAERAAIGVTVDYDTLIGNKPGGPGPAGVRRADHWRSGAAVGL